MYKFFHKKNNKGGFTLVETLIAISIFSLSILALMSVLGQGISSTNYAKKKIVASYLAQEGIEYIRNMRDTYVLYGASSQTGWDSFITKITANSCTTDGCYFNPDNIDYIDNTQAVIDMTISPCSPSRCSNAPLFYNSSTGKYNYSLLGTNSGYTRKITATLIGSPANEIKISSTVYWTQGSGDSDVSFSENLFNWAD